MDRVRYLVGILALAAVVAVGWFVFGLLEDEDGSGLFELRLEFRDVRGLKPGGDVRYRGVPVGSVRAVELSRDGEKGLVTIALDTGVEKLACQSSRFWVVSPRFAGLGGGATGLDTLVRDSYVVFLTESPAGPPLAPGSLVAGLEKPLIHAAEAGLQPVRHGDLEMTLLVPENYSLSLGAEVRYRGLATGDVRRIELAEDGSHVRLSLRIDHRHRTTVVDSSAFWVARPRLSGALLSGLAVHDLGALLKPFIGYYSEPGKGLPVPDGYVVAAVGERPRITESDIPPAALKYDLEKGPAVEETERIRVVRVIYQAEEADWFSGNDHVKREGTGLLFVDGQGRAVVLTSRSLCDGSYFMSDTFGTAPDIKKEAIRVVIPGSSVLRAGRSWVDLAGGDLALLVLENAPANLPSTAAAFVAGEEVAADGKLELMIVDEPEPRVVEATSLPDVEECRGAIVVVGEKVIGVLGQRDSSDLTTVVQRITRLPAGLRPGT